MAYLPKVEITLWVEDMRVEEVVRTIVEIARTGRMGDGKIFVLPILPGGAREMSGSNSASDSRRLSVPLLGTSSAFQRANILRGIACSGQWRTVLPTSLECRTSISRRVALALPVFPLHTGRASHPARESDSSVDVPHGILVAGERGIVKWGPGRGSP